MDWFKMDSTAWQHPKIRDLTDPAFRLWINGLSYAAQFETDGWLPHSIASRRIRAAHQLVAVALWKPADDDDGWWIHDYLDHQKSKAELDELREQRRAAGARGGRARRQAKP